MKTNDESPSLKKESLNKKLIMYSVAAGMTLSLGSRAQADIKYTDIDPDKVITQAENFQTNDYYLDLNKDGTPEFKIFQSYSYTYYYYSLYSYDSVKALPINNGLALINATGDNNYVAALNSNDLISSQQNFGTHHILGGLSYYETSPGGEWPDMGNRFMGVKFKIGENIHYGWVRLSVSDLCTKFTVYDYAYEDEPGKAIKAGDTGIRQLDETTE